MTWTRLDDAWTDLPELAALRFDVRWHYLAMIQFCSRTKRYDGVLKLADARRCSDVDDPAAAITELTTAGLLVQLSPSSIKVGHIDDHIPPPSVREHSAKTKIRMSRYRRHKNGDHSECIPGNCDQVKVDTTTGEVTGDVTRNPGTGQDGTGQDYEHVALSVSQDHTTPQNDHFDLEAQMQEESPGSGEKSPRPQPWAALTYYGGAAS